MPRERNLAGLAPISLPSRATASPPSRATARVAPTIRRIALLWPCIVGATLAVALALALALALAPLSSRIWAGPAGSRSGGLLYKADLLCSSN